MTFLDALKLIGILALCVLAMILVGWLLMKSGYIGYITGRPGWPDEYDDEEDYDEGDYFDDDDDDWYDDDELDNENIDKNDDET